MKNVIENAGSVEEIFQALSQACNNSGANADLKEILVGSAIQNFLALMPKFLQFGEEEVKVFLQYLSVYHDPTTDPLNRNTAFIYLYEALVGSTGPSEPEPTKTKTDIIRCEKSQTPCEDCESPATHRIKFVLDKRTEEHFLCESCEDSARRE